MTDYATWYCGHCFRCLYGVQKLALDGIPIIRCPHCDARNWKVPYTHG